MPTRWPIIIKFRKKKKEDEEKRSKLKKEEEKEELKNRYYSIIYISFKCCVNIFQQLPYPIGTVIIL
jgi:hypothetical protein